MVHYTMQFQLEKRIIGKAMYSLLQNLNHQLEKN
jgi:hypothetical protein